MKLFGSFLVVFSVIFAVVLVVTGEWSNRVEPALRRVVVERMLGDELVQAIDEASAQVSADSLVHLLEGVGADGTATAARTAVGHAGGRAGTGGGSAVPILSIFDPAADIAWFESQADSMRQVRERLADMSGQILALQTQLKLLRTARQAGEMEAWRSLGKVFASMRAEEASRIIEHLPESQAVQLLSSMNPRDSAELMGKLEPGRAARLSGRLSSYWRDLQTEAKMQ